MLGSKRTVAIIQARLNSTRLPGKVLREICGKPLLLHVIDRVLMCKHVDAVVVASCYEGGGGTIAGRCHDWDLPCYLFPGSEHDVLGRLRQAAVVYDADLIVRVCGDNPLINPWNIDHLVRAIRHYQADYAGYEIRAGEPAILVPTGYFAEVVTREALERAEREARLPPHREHVTSYIYQHSDQFACYWAPMPRWYTEEKPPNAAVDTTADLERVTELIEQQGGGVLA